MVNAAAPGCLLARLALGLAAVATLVAVPTAAIAATRAPARALVSPAVTPTEGTKVAAADYFGIANPYDFWSSDLSGAPQAFRQMRADGFNAVGLVVPWDDFEPSLDPPTYNSTDFYELSYLVSLAGFLHLGVVLRLSYATDVDPRDQDGWGERFNLAYGDPTVYEDWLNFMAFVHQQLEPYSNVDLAYLSWEDLWVPVGTASILKGLHQRIAFAREIGFTSWLEQRMSLTQAGQAYGTTFTSWSQVPTPLRYQRAFKLMFRFYDDMVVNRFFLPALNVFPGLTLEARDDVDLIWNGNQIVGGFQHDAQWALPGTDLTGVDYAPYMRDPSSSYHETAEEAYEGLKATLAFISRRTGGRRLFINQFLFMDNARLSASLPHIAPSQLRPFLHLALGPFDQYTDGYGVWTYRDYNVSPVYNPSFSLGTVGWATSGPVTTTPSSPGSPSYATVGPEGRVTQDVPLNKVGPTGQSPFTVSVAARPESGDAHLKVHAGSAPVETLSLSAGWHTYQLSFAGSDFASGQLQLSAPSKVEISDVQMYNFTENGDVYGPNGAPRLALPALQWLNKRIVAAPSPAG